MVRRCTIPWLSPHKDPEVSRVFRTLSDHEKGETHGFPTGPVGSRQKTEEAMKGGRVGRFGEYSRHFAR